MSTNATIIFQNGQFIIGKEEEWFYIYEEYKDKLVLVFETSIEQDAVNYILENTIK